MRARQIPFTCLILVFAIEALDTNARKKYKEKISNDIVNICDISDRDAKIHCYCENSQEINEAIKTDCWVFNGGIERADPLWSSFISQTNIETLAFNVRADGGLDFVPSRVLKYLRKIKFFSIKHSFISKIETNTFSNITSLQEMTLTKNQIITLSKHSFTNLPNLTVLTLDDNRIDKLVAETFYEMPKLQKLYLTKNNISEIQDGAFKHLVNLLELEIDKNNISELKKECFNGLANLKRLDIRKNKLTVLKPFIFTELWNLQELLLDYNEIYVVAQRTFDGLSQLRKLSLSHNKLVTLTSGLFEGVRGLYALDLRHNKLKRFTFDNISPIYENLKGLSSYIYLEGNDFDCDCYLEWMHRLRHEARSVKVRTSLENFICKLGGELSPNLNSNYYEKTTSTMIFYENDEKIQNTDYTEDLFHEEIDDAYGGDIKATNIFKGENGRTFLQIPVQMLPCPQDVKSVTDRTYTYPSQNEAKDYRNLIGISKSTKLTIEQYLVVIIISIVIFS